MVNSTGRLVPGHEREQSALLRGEGVEVRDGKVRRAATGASVGRVASGQFWPSQSGTVLGEIGRLRRAELGVLDLDEREADVAERVAHRAGLGPDAVAEALDQARDGVDRQRGLGQVGRRRRRGGWPPARTGPSRGW